MPEGKYYRRGHWVRKGRPKSKGSGWLILAVAAGLAWFLISGPDEPQTPAPHPASVSDQTPPAPPVSPLPPEPPEAP